MGIPTGFKEAHKGASIRIPALFGPIMKYVTPLFLLAIFFFWVSENLFGYNLITGQASPSGYVMDLFGKDANQVAWLSVTVILLLIGFVFLIVNSSDHFKKTSHTSITETEETQS